jgi:hypothetical protein
MRFITFLIITLFSVENSLALTCDPSVYGIDRQMSAAKTIVIGRIVAGGKIDNNKMKPEFFEATYEVIETFKGSAKVENKVISDSMTMGGIQFTLGRKYLFFITSDSYVGYCGGSQELEPTDIESNYQKQKLQILRAYRDENP